MVAPADIIERVTNDATAARSAATIDDSTAFADSISRVGVGSFRYRLAMTAQFVCPTDAPPTLGPDESIILGCGNAFTGELDDEGLVDCPHCGIWFDPTVERTGTSSGATA